jgi:hypothetical protein
LLDSMYPVVFFGALQAEIQHDGMTSNKDV